MSNIRSAFKVKDVEKARKIVEKQNEDERKVFADKYSEKRTKFISFSEENNNTIIAKILPAHEGPEIAPYKRTHCVLWLKIPFEKKDKDGTVIINPKTKKPEVEIQQRQVFNARIHGGLSKDPAELYVKYAELAVKDNSDSKEELEENLKKIQGEYPKYPGIKFNTNSVCYIVLVDPKDPYNNQTPIHLFTLNKSLKQGLKTLGTNDDDQTIEEDFSDIDEGSVLKFTKTNGPKISYSVNTWHSKTLTKGSSIVPTSDKALEEFTKLDSLTKLYINSYTMRDYNMCIEGLKYFDKENKFGVFKNEDFIEELESIKLQVEELEKTNKSNSENSSNNNEEDEEDEKPKKSSERKDKNKEDNDKINDSFKSKNDDDDDDDDDDEEEEKTYVPKSRKSRLQELEEAGDEDDDDN